MADRRTTSFDYPDQVIHALTPQDQHAIAEVTELLATRVDGGPPVLELAMPAIARLIGSEDKWSAYTIDAHGEQLRIARLYSNFVEVERARRDLNALIAAHPVDWASYDASRPEPRDQNIAVDTVRRLGWQRSAQVPNVRYVLVKYGLSRHGQLRAMVCEGGSLLAFVSGWRPGEVYTHRERRRLQAVVPALRRRLLLERRIGEGALFEAAFDAAFDALPAAFLLGRDGAVLHANTAARRLRERREAPALADLVRGRVAGWQLTRVRAAGAPEVLLAVQSDAGMRLPELVARAIGRYGLTPRQGEVLALLAEGCTYETMSVRLGCAVRTVETHVSAVLHKLDVASRAEAIARLWDPRG